jgi:hypothetical protein
MDLVGGSQHPVDWHDLVKGLQRERDNKGAGEVKKKSKFNGRGECSIY